MRQLSALSRQTFVLALLVALAVPAPSGAQSVFKRIKKNASEKVEARKTAAEDSLVVNAGKVVDSTVEKTGRGVDATVNKAVEVADTVMNRTERGVVAVASSLTGGADQIASDLESGRAVVREPLWVDGTAELAPEGADVIARIAQAMAATESVYLIETHVADGGDPAGEVALTDARAAALKAQLVAAGVPPSRLFAMAFGATRPPTDGESAERVELAKMQ